ncbi:CAP domain-containing protein [Mesorhizobium sp. VNQ89]|uniref:CAP domain-containing protein n=1 Tax=Mesorhizobium quangtriensis TaxID=3157709 RepID=UPI0032B8152F
MIDKPHRCSPAILPLVLAILLSVAGCQGVSPGSSAGGVGASSSGEIYLASIRREQGLPPLKPDAKLERAAAQQAGYMAGASKMTHRTGWRKDFATRMRENGVEGAAAENVAHGRMEPERLFRMWMDSSGHRRNMLDPRFGHYGLASATDDQGQKYWALVLGR